MVRFMERQEPYSSDDPHVVMEYALEELSDIENNIWGMLRKADGGNEQDRRILDLIDVIDQWLSDSGNQRFFGFKHQSYWDKKESRSRMKESVTIGYLRNLAKELETDLRDQGIPVRFHEAGAYGSYNWDVTIDGAGSASYFTTGYGSKSEMQGYLYRLHREISREWERFQKTGKGYFAYAEVDT